MKLYVSDLHVSVSGSDPDYARAWKHAHNNAVSQYLEFRASNGEATQPPADEAGILALVDGVAFYVGRFGYVSDSHPDSVLTPAVGAILAGIVTLLNGSIGRLDAGTVDGWARDVAARIGWNMDTEEVVYVDDDDDRPAYDEAIRQATREGEEAGDNAGTWALDSNLTVPEAQRILAGIDACDPEIMDMQPSPLSGEWADGLTPADVLEPYGRTPDDDDAGDILDAFEEGYSRGYWQRVESSARAALPDDPCLASRDARYRVRGWPAVAVWVDGYETRSSVRVVMVGDDRRHIVDVDELEPIADDDYCGECGQIGCAHDGRARA